MAEAKLKTGVRAETTERVPPTRRRITRRKAVEAVAHSYFDAIAARDPHAIAQLWAADGVADVVPYGPLRGPGEVKLYFRALFAAFPDLETSVESVFTSEREAAVRWRMTAHFTGDAYDGIEPTGSRVELRGVHVLEIEDGKAVAASVYYDGMSFARQVGLVPARDSAAERALKSALNASTKLRRSVAEKSEAFAGWRSER